MEPDEKEEILRLHIDEKVNRSKSVIREAINKFGIENVAIAITGGKDSTTNLWIYKQVCDEMGIKLPVCMFIDEGDIFDEIIEFINYIRQLWSLEITFLRNEDVSSKAKQIGDIIRVSSLNDANKRCS